VLKTDREKQSVAGKTAGPTERLTESIQSWVRTHPAQPLVFALEHHYTQRGLSLDLLKGADRQLSQLVVPAADNANCLVHLAQISRHLCQFADDGSFGDDYRGGYYRGYRPRRHEIEIGETYEDDLKGAEWTDIHGKEEAWGEIALDPSAIVSSIPIDDWKPTAEEFEGYTGNAGNTLDRRYHRSAVVLWHRDHHFDIVASCGAAVSIPLLRSMAAKVAKTPKKRLEQARTDCIRFALAIIAAWPISQIGYGYRASREKSPLDDFPEFLMTLHDRDTIVLFLSTMAERDQTLRLDAFIVAACRDFGWNTFAGELKQLIAAQPKQQGLEGMREQKEIPLRDIEWLSAFCLDKLADPDKSALAHELCALAVERFCAPRPSRPAHYWLSARRERSVSETSLPLLLKALAASGRDQDLARVTQFVESSPDDFNLDDCQVPALKTLVPWSHKH
jgi:hypothetical protein